MALKEHQITIAGKERVFYPFIDGGIFRISPRKWPNWYVYMKDDIWTGDLHGRNDPNDQCDFKFTRISESSQYYLISAKRWPEWYVYMEKENGNVRGKKGDPGPQGHWSMEPGPDGTFLFSTEKWSQSYMYMQNFPTGDVQGTDELNEQAYFILSCEIRLKTRYVRDTGGYDPVGGGGKPVCGMAVPWKLKW